MNPLRLILTAAFAAALSLHAFAADNHGVDPDYAKKNLDQVPATDPPATNAPPLVSAVAGQHPRLLYTQADIDALKARIPNDPILKATYDDNLKSYQRFKLQPWDADHPPAMVLDDTAAIAGAVPRIGGLAIFYSLTKDPKLKDAIVSVFDMMMAQPYWANTQELDSSMGGACNMLMMALLFDAVCNDLDPAYRAKVADSINTHARRLYYLGFMQRSLLANKYWQQDPQPNHRWYRIAGEMSSLLAIQGEPNVKVDYLLQEMNKELAFVMHWYPPDGDCHEGAGYQQFGFASILRAASMSDRDLGTTYLKDTGLSKAWAQQIYYNTPSGAQHMSFGDDMNGTGIFIADNAAFFACMAINRDKDAQAAYMNFYNSKNFFPARDQASLDQSLGNARVLRPDRRGRGCQGPADQSPLRRSRRRQPARFVGAHRHRLHLQVRPLRRLQVVRLPDGQCRQVRQPQVR